MPPQNDSPTRVFHDLTNTLTVVRARLQLIRRRIDRGTGEWDQVRTHLTEIETHLLRAIDVVGVLYATADETR